MRLAPIPVSLLFRQQISHAEALESYQIEVVKAPGRGWGGPLTPHGLDDTQIRAIRTLYRGYLKRQRTATGLAISEQEIEPLRAAGSQLFRALPNTIQDRLRQVQALAWQTGQLLELTLIFEPGAQPLASLPWELLHDPERRYFFALHGGLMRQLRFSTAPKIDPGYAPHSILGLWAEPANVENLSIRKQFTPAPGRVGWITWIEGSDSLNQLEEQLTTGLYDGLHITAHGRADENGSDLSLAFVAQDGSPLWLSPDQIATLIAQYPVVRFVYLDVCHSGDSLDDYAPGGLAGKLLGMGISSVVVMQDEITQNAAGLLAQVFYHNLANQVPSSQAMTAARTAVRVRQDDPAHWSVPAFYSQETLPAENTLAVDKVLDRIPDLLRPLSLWLLILALLIGQLSYAFANQSTLASNDIKGYLLLVTESILLPLLAACAMCLGQDQIAVRYNLKGKQWLEVLVHKYTAAFVWGFMAWVAMTVVWLGLSWAGITTHLSPGMKQIIWGIALAGLAGAGYVGARQAIRQKMLFLRLGPSSVKASNWILLFGIELLPIGLAWLIALAWPFLASTLIGVYLVIAMLIVVIIGLR